MSKTIDPKNQEKQFEYRDDQGVTITGLSLCVRQKLYPLEYISDCGESFLRPNRKPGIFLMMLGVGAGLMGLSEWSTPEPLLTTMGITFSHVEFVIMVASLILILSFIQLLFQPKRYIVWINFEGREFHVVESRNKNYIKKISSILSRRLSQYNKSEHHKAKSKENRSVVYSE